MGRKARSWLQQRTHCASSLSLYLCNGSRSNWVESSSKRIFTTSRMLHGLKCTSADKILCWGLGRTTYGLDASDGSDRCHRTLQGWWRWPVQRSASQPQRLRQQAARLAKPQLQVSPSGAPNVEHDWCKGWQGRAKAQPHKIEVYDRDKS